MWTIFSLYWICYNMSFWLQDMWNLSFPTRDQTHIPSIGRRSLNQWTTTEVLRSLYFNRESWNATCFPCSELFLLHANKKVYSGPKNIWITYFQNGGQVSKFAGSQSKLNRVIVIESERYLFFFTQKKKCRCLCPSLIILMIHLPENRWEKRSKSLS